MANVTIINAKKLLPPESILRFEGGSTSITVTDQSYDTQLNGSASNDPDGSISSYIWERRLAGGLWAQLGSTIFSSYTNTVSVTGTYEYRLKVVDNDNLSTYSNVITLNFTKAALISPVAEINGETTEYINSISANNRLLLNGQLSSAGGIGDTLVSATWEMISTPTSAIYSLNSQGFGKTEFIPTTTGSYIIQLEVVSSNGLTDTINALITVYV